MNRTRREYRIVEFGAITMNLRGLLGALLPVFFVLALGYLAGKRRSFDADQAAGLSKLAFLVRGVLLRHFSMAGTVASRGNQVSASFFRWRISSQLDHHSLKYH